MAIEIKEQIKIDAEMLFPDLKIKVRGFVENYMKDKKNTTTINWNVYLTIDYTQSLNEENQIKIF